MRAVLLGVVQEDNSLRTALNRDVLLPGAR